MTTYKTDKNKIESTIFDDCMAVNQIAVLNRMIELLNDENVNSNEFLSDQNRFNYECSLWLLIALATGIQCSEVSMHDWWIQLNAGIISTK